MKFISAADHIVPLVDVVPTPDKGGIKSLKYMGTGVFVEPTKILTCAHVLRNIANTPCVVGKAFTDKETYSGISNFKFHPKADLVIAEIKKDFAYDFSPLTIDFEGERYLGKDILNFSYTEGYREGYQLTLTPRLNKGHIMRTSRNDSDLGPFYIEINFAALRGMSGSPIIDADTAEVLGIISQNFRSQILDDYHEEYSVSDDNDTITETNKTFKVVDYAIAVDLQKYTDFFQ